MVVSGDGAVYFSVTEHKKFIYIIIGKDTAVLLAGARYVLFYFYSVFLLSCLSYLPFSLSLPGRWHARDYKTLSKTATFKTTSQLFSEK